MDITNTLNEIIDFNLPKKLPFLESICWQIVDVYKLTPEEMLSSYERGWRYRDIFNNLDGEELDFLKEIATKYRSWLVVDLCNVRLERHNQIFSILQCLNCDVLRNGSTYFGGGTVLALNFGLEKTERTF